MSVSPRRKATPISPDELLLERAASQARQRKISEPAVERVRDRAREWRAKRYGKKAAGFFDVRVRRSEYLTPRI